MRLKKILYMISNNNILTTSNLSIGYTSKATTTIIAENLNLNLQAGKLIALIGANGIGKSTLLRTIGIQKPLSGTIALNGKKYSSNRCLDCSAEPKCGTN
jgi:iron complex transport system ATP-binding protein